MTTKEIADRLVELNRTATYKDVYKELYSDDIVSVENWSGKRDVYTGMDALRKKGEKWEEGLVEMHEMKVSEPLIADNSFAVTFYIDGTFKDMGDEGRQKMTELAIYVVKDGKVVHEEFFG